MTSHSSNGGATSRVARGDVVTYHPSASGIFQLLVSDLIMKISKSDIQNQCSIQVIIRSSQIIVSIEGNYVGKN